MKISLQFQFCNQSEFLLGFVLTMLLTNEGATLLGH